MRLSLTAACATLALLVGAPVASAIKIAPPGNSAVSEYVENVPGANGNVPSNSIRGGGHGSGALPAGTLGVLAAQGSDGARAAALANATAPAGAAKAHRTRHSKHGQGAAVPGAGGGPSGGATAVTGAVPSASNAVLKAATGSATHGLGALLPVILVLSALGAGFLAVLRRRQGA